MGKKNASEKHKATSKFLSLVLRHDPSAAGVEMDECGWVEVSALIPGLSKVLDKPINREMLEEIVSTDSKNRYSFSEDGRFIRANQGHSIPVDLGLKVVEPPEFLYHGTATRFLDSIEEKGILPNGRMYVHLSNDIETAANVGARHGESVVLRVFAKRMEKEQDDCAFYLSQNGVWLTGAIEPKYFERIA